MTFLNQLPQDKQDGITELLDREISLCKKQKKIAKQIQRKLVKRIKFFEDVKNNLQSVENLGKVVGRKVN